MLPLTFTVEFLWSIIMQDIETYGSYILEVMEKD